MAEMMWCNIEVRAPRAWIAKDERGYDVLMFPDGYEKAEPGETYAADPQLMNGDACVMDHPTDPASVLVQFNGEGNYGLADDDLAAFLAECRRVGVPYSASDDPKYDIPGTVRIVGDGVEISRTATEGGAVVLDECDYRTMRAAAGDDHGAFAAAVAAYFDVPEAGSLPLYGLAAAAAAAALPSA